MLLFDISSSTVAGYYSKLGVKTEVILKISKARLLLNKYLRS